MTDTRPSANLTTGTTQDAKVAQCEAYRAANPTTVKGTGAELEVGFWLGLASLAAIPWGAARNTARNLVAGKTLTDATEGDKENTFWRGL